MYEYTMITDYKGPWEEGRAYHSHVLHLAHELDEDSVENLSDAGQVCVGPGRDEK